jgi:AraC family transcriptional regulator
MHAWESIQNVLDFIEGNLSQSHSTEELSKVAALSPFYFQRLFTCLVKRPVNEYIKMRRLARACETLADKSKCILDIALENGFNSHESFTKNFKAAFGITPDEYRANPVHLNQIIKPELLLNYTMIDEGVPLITENIVIEITRKRLDYPEIYIGLSEKVSVEQAGFGETTGVSSPGQLWELFHKKKSGLSCFSPDGIEFGASSLSEVADDGTFNYFAGAPAEPYAVVPDGFTTWELPAAEYLVCTFEAETFEELTTSALNKALGYLFNTWLPGRKMMTQPFSAEKYTGATADAAVMEIWVIPIPALGKEGR